MWWELSVSEAFAITSTKTSTGQTRLDTLASCSAALLTSTLHKFTAHDSNFRQCHPQWHPLVILFGPPCPGSTVGICCFKQCDQVWMAWYVARLTCCSNVSRVGGRSSNGCDFLVKNCCQAESRSVQSLVLSYSSTTNVYSTDGVVPS